MIHDIAWFSFGFVTCLVLVLGVAPFVLSGKFSRREEQHPLLNITNADPEPEPAPPIDAKLAEAETKAEFYYRMATGQD